MKIVTRHNRSTVTFVKEPHPGEPYTKNGIIGVELDILGSDSDDDDMFAYAWLSVKEAESLAYGLLRLINSKK